MRLAWEICINTLAMKFEARYTINTPPLTMQCSRSKAG